MHICRHNPLYSVVFIKHFFKDFFRFESYVASNPLICISAFNLDYLHRYLLPVAQDGWGISWIHVEISFCWPKKNRKILKLNAKKMHSTEIFAVISFHGYCPDELLTMWSFLGWTHVQKIKTFICTHLSCTYVESSNNLSTEHLYKH